MNHVCDCGQVYTSHAALDACQAANHSAAAGCELADAERFMRDCGLDPNACEEEADGNVLELVPQSTPCAKVTKLRSAGPGGEVWDDWCYKHHHWLNGAPVTRTALDELLDSCAELCPHGMPLAENICGPCSKGRPNHAP